MDRLDPEHPAIPDASGGRRHDVVGLRGGDERLTHYGFTDRAGMFIGITALACAVLYLLPPTAVLGAILVTGYLGGAVVTHVRAQEPFFIPILFGVVIWLGLFLRDPRLRVLIPFRF